MSDNVNKCLVVLGPTASGKTSLGVALARLLDGEILSADSRQVYRGLDLGSGKDLAEYSVDGVEIPYHLIDIVDLTEEYNVFRFQQDFFEAFEAVQRRDKLPVIVGGTGLYLDAVLRGYRMLDTPENPELRAELAALPFEDVLARLHALKPDLHNTTDLTDQDRLIRAIEIAEHARDQEPEPTPPMTPLILGTRWDRTLLRDRIALRLKERMDLGMIEEVEHLHTQGVAWERLELLGLEYRFIAQYLQGDIKNKNDLFQKLNSAIAQFAKRQDTWFRRMERRGSPIHWIDQAALPIALSVMREQG